MKRLILGFLAALVLAFAATVGAATTQNLIWVYVCDGPFSHNHEWVQHEETYQEGDYCSLSDPGASDGFVRCSASQPSGNPGEPPEGLSASAPVSILD
jgi:hypothetical protein